MLVPLKVVDYYLTPGSPWTYLGHARFAEIAQARGAVVRVKPVDLGVVFPQTGGVPVPQRPRARQAYRLAELRRWQAYLGVPLVIQPRHYPVDATPALRLISAAPEDRRMALAGDLLAAMWRDDLDIADPDVLREIGSRHGAGQGDAAALAAFTSEALARGVFGAPSYVYRDEIFWGQDRLDFLDRALAA